MARFIDKETIRTYFGTAIPLKGLSHQILWDLFLASMYMKVWNRIEAPFSYLICVTPLILGGYFKVLKCESCGMHWVEAK